MKKIISGLIMFALLFNIFIVNAYSINEGAENIENVIDKLEDSDYSFKYNAGSSAKASYHVFHNDKMIGYIYATDNGITLGEGWDSNGELGIFFNQKDLTTDEIVDRFYIDKSPLGESDFENNTYLCSGNTEDFFKCLSNYSNKDKNSEGVIYLFKGDIKKDINITINDDILYKSIDSNGVTLTCNIKKENKDDFISMLSKWELGAFSNKDFDYAECNETINIVNENNSTDFNLDDLINFNGNVSGIGEITDSSLIKGDNYIVNDLNIANQGSLNDGVKLINGLKGGFIDSVNQSVLLKSTGVNSDGNNILYADGLDIINDTNKRLINIDRNIEDDSLKSRMLLYRKMWNNLNNELKKNILGKEGLRIKYLHKKVEENYKELFKEYVLSNKINAYSNDSGIISNNDIEVNNIDNKKVSEVNNVNIPDALMNNFKNLFGLLSNKYNKEGNFSTLDKKNMELLFNKVDKYNKYNSINDFLSRDSLFLKDSYNIDLLQKLMILMCTH